MLSNSTNSIINQQFWKTFGQYMSPVPSAEGDKINWVNYKTGVKFFRFTMQQRERNVRIAIELTNPNIIVHTQEFEQLCELKKEFYNICGDDWIWTKIATDANGITCSSISRDIKNVNILKEEDWPSIISFLKIRIISLDNFWNNYKYIFQF